MDYLKRYGISICLVCLCLYSCQEPNRVSKDDLLGKWIVMDAIRSGKKTLTLEGAFFHFTEGQMTTNYTGFEQQSNYELTDGKLKQLEPELTEFEIRKMALNQIELRATIQNLPFVFTLKKE
ncbi:MAG: hypothetical protein M3Q56_12755 [Bacteroidota bacterium]|nr:hypothetical protein [Bacteroidota bacterium]